ncbi:MAG TPA: fumarylacetoacetate hydrolase family protein [Stellaceae bacterium]|jgi:5-oxopent-3-ene-1,2,5-tricarboxylate decarboxylase/2-hydroxyhepta-2,4-diene-1,7-dioate isomerase|nr:fumarylacetoacetate hydrolase family protein [Stellaceae bacterium]
MSVLDGPRSELRHVVFGGSAYWADYENGELRLGDGRIVAERDVTYLPPCNPTKIICIHLNYMSRLYEFTGANKPPATPTYFQKPVTAINSHNGELVRPEGYQYLNYEGEVAAIIGKVTRNITPDQVWDHVRGFAPGNDVGLQDMRDTDAGSMLRVKGGDGFCPVGPGIVSGIDIRKQTLRTYRNGKLAQEGAISEMLFPIDYIIADLARHITLVPGDVVMTGTPANSRPMAVGDLIEVEVTGLGRLSNRVVSSPAPRATVGHQPTDSDGVRRVALGNEERLPAQLKKGG